MLSLSYDGYQLRLVAHEQTWWTYGLSALTPADTFLLEATVLRLESNYRRTGCGLAIDGPQQLLYQSKSQQPSGDRDGGRDIIYITPRQRRRSRTDQVSVERGY